MKARLLALSVATLICLPAQAIDWPWQEQGSTPYEYCQGFTVASLHQTDLGDLSRIDLWLAWNEIIRNGPALAEAGMEQYQTGFDQVTTLMENDGLQTITDIAEGDCALGRN